MLHFSVTKSAARKHTTHHEQNALGLVSVHAAQVHAQRARVLPRDHALSAVRQLAVEQHCLRALGELDRLARVPRDGRLGGEMTVEEFIRRMDRDEF